MSPMEPSIREQKRTNQNVGNEWHQQKVNVTDGT